FCLLWSFAGLVTDNGAVISCWFATVGAVRGCSPVSEFVDVLGASCAKSLGAMLFLLLSLVFLYLWFNVSISLAVFVGS
ncbi:hypothetical protein Ancab_002291, partial [Ancistrocladus abbreviatus]